MCFINVSLWEKENVCVIHIFSGCANHKLYIGIIKFMTNRRFQSSMCVRVGERERGRGQQERDIIDSYAPSVSIIKVVTQREHDWHLSHRSLGQKTEPALRCGCECVHLRVQGMDAGSVSER